MTSAPGVDSVLRELVFLGPPAAADCAAHVPSSEGSAGLRCALDFDTPETWPDLAYDTAAPASRHDAGARERVAAVLHQAAGTMAGCAPAAFRLVDAQLQRVLLRQDPGSAGTSTSHRAHVGRCLLTNLHRPPPAQAALVAVEALTHEAIHQLLYRTEAAGGPFCDLVETPSFRSPWTGARLPLHSLVHASFVWFGLLTLWCQLAQVGPPQLLAVHARQRIAHCLFGFAFLDDLLGSPAFPVASVQRPVLLALRAVAAATLRATQAAEPVHTLGGLASTRQGARWPAALAESLAGAVPR